MWWVVVSLVLSWSSQTSAVAAPAVPVSCRDENNNAVDWYILYKAPQIHYSFTGLEYIYMDPTAGWRTGSKNINNPNGVLANTLRPMLGSVRNMPKTFGFLSYNDQPPGSSANEKFGHSKGVVLGDSGTQTALWLTHSTPQFPFRRDQNNFWPPTGNSNAQTFMCVSLEFSDLKTVGEHLQRIQAFPFDYDLTIDFLYITIDSRKIKELRDAANWVPSDSDSLEEFKTLTTKGKQQLRIMAKQFIPQLKKTAGVKTTKDLTLEEIKKGDLYVQLARKLKSEVHAKVWGCQRDKDKSYCEVNEPRVMNVIDITLGEWSWTKDHSKWAVTTADNIYWTCICDMNRARSQYERRGGALCIQNYQINMIFRGFVKHILECNQSPYSSGDCDSE